MTQACKNVKPPGHPSLQAAPYAAHLYPAPLCSSANCNLDANSVLPQSSVIEKKS